MKGALLVFAWLMAGLAGPAVARIPPEALERVGVQSTPGAVLPLEARFLDEQGRPITLSQAVAGGPSLLVFADYRCTNVCGPALVIAAAALHASGLRPGRDYRLVGVGLRPGEPPAEARAFRTSRLAEAPELSSAVFLTGGAEAIGAATRAAGYHYAFDPETGQFVHPVAAFVLTPEGRLSRALPEISLTGPELRSAILNAGRGETGSLMDRILVLCHGLDPASGIYTGAVQTGLRIGATATLMAMAAGLFRLTRRRRTAS